MKKIILCLTVFSFIMADIYISGDARIRPRYDIKENGDGSSTSDLYYLYRARINLKSDIGDGWFFNSKIGTNDLASFSKMGVDGDYTSGPGITNSNRPELHFLNLYFGYMKDACGFWAGAFPLKGNSALDLHFYSDKPVDIPWTIQNNNSITGFSGYQKIKNYKLNWFLSIDNNVVNEAIDSDDNSEELKDSYTLGFNTTFKGKLISVTPRFLMSMGNEELVPMTYGADFNLPDLAGFSSSIFYYMTSNGKEDDDFYYKGDHLRFLISRSIGSGSFKIFYDIASRDDDETSFLWLSYSKICYEGENGKVMISPTFRLQNGKNVGSVVDDFDENYSRMKFELTTEIIFK